MALLLSIIHIYDVFLPIYSLVHAASNLIFFSPIFTPAIALLPAADGVRSAAAPHTC